MHINLSWFMMETFGTERLTGHNSTHLTSKTIRPRMKPVIKIEDHQREQPVEEPWYCLWQVMTSIWKVAICRTAEYYCEINVSPVTTYGKERNKTKETFSLPINPSTNWKNVSSNYILDLPSWQYCELKGFVNEMIKIKRQTQKT